MSKQLRLLPAPKPLMERLGLEFFQAVPRVPGVYRMLDEAGLLLYVGQSGNLHDRLNSYRHVHPDRDSRKTVRLVHLVRRIEWEVHPTPAAAVLRENELLRTLRPRFNRMNVYPRACCFIALAQDAELVRLTLTREAEREGKTFGAFTGAAGPFASLCRLLFLAAAPDLSLHQFPSRLLTSRPLRSQELKLNAAAGRQLENYLAGESMLLVEQLTDICARVAMRTPFEQNLMLADLVELEKFYARGPVKVRRLRHRASVVTPWVEPELLVDFLATDRLASAASGPLLVEV